MNNLIQLYEKVVERNSEAVDRAEQLLKVLILVMPAKFGIKSEHTAQAACSVVNLFSLYNKLIALRGETRTRKAIPASLLDVTPESVVPLAWASAIEHVSLFIEMYSNKKLGGIKSKWTAITIIEIIRALIQLRILYLNHGDIVVRHHLTQSSPLFVFGSDNNGNSNNNSAESNNFPMGNQNVISYEESRWWEKSLRNGRRRFIPITRTFAEILRIIRPLIGLIAMKKYGIKSWKSWMISLGTELLSRTLHSTTASSSSSSSSMTRLTQLQKGELIRRDYLLFVFLLMTPCFEAIFQSKVALWTAGKLNNVPVLGSISNFIEQFVRLYRKHYFNLSFI